MANAFKISNLTEAQKTWLKEQAASQGISMAAVVKQLISAAMKGNTNG